MGGKDFETKYFDNAMDEALKGRGGERTGGGKEREDLLVATLRKGALNQHRST